MLTWNTALNGLIILNSTIIFQSEKIILFKVARLHLERLSFPLKLWGVQTQWSYTIFSSCFIIGFHNLTSFSPWCRQDCSFTCYVMGGKYEKSTTAWISHIHLHNLIPLKENLTFVIFQILDFSFKGIRLWRRMKMGYSSITFILWSLFIFCLTSQTPHIIVEPEGTTERSWLVAFVKNMMFYPKLLIHDKYIWTKKHCSAFLTVWFSPGDRMLSPCDLARPLYILNNNH